MRPFRFKRVALHCRTKWTLDVGTSEAQLVLSLVLPQDILQSLRIESSAPTTVSIDVVGWTGPELAAEESKALPRRQQIV